MDTTMHKAEATILTALLSLGLVMFFFPLLVIQAPIVGDHSISGYDVLSTTKNITSNAGSDTSASEKQTGSSLPTDVPMSIRFAWLIALSIFLSLLCAAMALFCIYFYSALVKSVSLIGACFGGFALLHVTILSSDMKTWLSASMQSGLQDNMFAGLASLMVNSFQIRPGGGLYVLFASLALVTVLAYSGVLAHIRIAASRDESA